MQAHKQLDADTDLRALIDMSRAVSTPAPLCTVLSMIAGKAEELAEAQGAAILLLDGHDQLRFAGGHGISVGYESFAEGWRDRPVSEAQRSGRPVVISDTETDARFKSRRRISRQESYRALIALPLRLGTIPIGVLAVYRREPRSWSPDALDFLELIGAHVASIVRTVQLLDEQKHRVAAHARLVRGLREQTRDHLTRIKELQLQLDAGSPEVAGLVAGLESQLSEAYTVVAERIQAPVIASLLLGEMGIARQKGVQFRLDRRSRLIKLPARLGESEAVSLVGNLLQNAFDAVAELPAQRRRVTLLIRESGGQVRFRVRDWGVGLPELADKDLLEHGFSTKPGHSGVGLAIVAGISEAAGGWLKVERPAIGAVFEAGVPNS